jgi:thiosulfate reductase cytochrome b subunit
MTDVLQPSQLQTARSRHRSWVRVCHWTVTVSFLTLAFTGVVILMAHPRLYWGEVGNNLTPALVELPISRNHQHGGWVNRAAFYEGRPSAVSANRTYDIFNQNGWGRSLHFLAAWLLVIPGAFYLLAGLFTGHFRFHLSPRRTELTPRQLAADVIRHLHLRIPPATGGPDYGPLQKCAYCGVIFVVLPLMVLTGLAMSPTVTASTPLLRSMFGGFQSARTIHFFLFVALVIFLIVHVVMILKSGFKRQMRGMTLGE